MSKRKYVKGNRITGLNELVEQEFIMWNGKVYHRGFFMSWQVQMACSLIQQSALFRAVRKSDEEMSAASSRTVKEK